MAPATTTTTTTITPQSATVIASSEQPFTTLKGYTANSRGGHNLAKGFPHPYPLPTFTNKKEERQWAKEHMAGAFRIFSRKGYTEGTAGHISIRDPIDPETFWINPLAIHFGLIKASDLVHVDELGNVLPDGNQAAINTAGFMIHSALHKARRDVNAACHTHSVYGKAYSALGKPLDMINQDACTFYNSHAVYNDFGGVAFDPKEGQAIAKAIGNGKGAILRNHGLITVGETVDEAAYLFTLMERCCECQLLANAALGPGESLQLCSDESADYTEQVSADPDTLYGEFQPDYNYELAMSGGDFLK